MVPMESPEAVDALRAGDISEPAGTFGAYFFCFTGPDMVTARFFGTGVGVTEDAATGSAAACLGLYLGQRLGQGRVSVSQGSHIGRPSRLHVRFDRGSVRVGGHVVPVGTGTLRV
jgi:trans-2,3-dihydro-3-hydroxyanthranilate isomerase